MKHILLQQLYGTLLDYQVCYFSSDMIMLWRSSSHSHLGHGIAHRVKLSVQFVLKIENGIPRPWDFSSIYMKGASFRKTENRYNHIYI